MNNNALAKVAALVAGAFVATLALRGKDGEKEEKENAPSITVAPVINVPATKRYVRRRKKSATVQADAAASADNTDGDNSAGNDTGGQPGGDNAANNTEQ